MEVKNDKNKTGLSSLEKKKKGVKEKQNTHG